MAAPARLACLALLLLAACKEENRFVAPPPPRVTVATPAQERITRHIEATGNALAVNSIDLVARVPGFVAAVNYRDGTLVQRGTVLFTLDQVPYQASLDRARATEASAQARLTQATADFQRQASLRRDQVAAQADLDSARASRDSAQASLADAQAQVKLAELDLFYTQVAAPFAGVAMARVVSQGAYVGAGSPTKLATLVQLDPIYVSFSLSEREAFAVRDELRRRGQRFDPNNPIEIEAALPTDAGFPLRGRLDYIGPMVDQASGTLQLRATFPNPEAHLLPGAFVRVRLPWQRDVPVLLVSETAVGADQTGRYLRVIGEGNRVEHRRVRLGPLLGGRRVIEEGLRPEDRVVVGALQRALPGLVVDPQPEAASAAVPVR
jgi:RND family efflux transporter MFP subunit